MLKKYKKISKEIRASFWFMFSTILQKGIAFLTIPFFTSIMTSAEYGKYTLFLSWQEILTIFATLNLNYQVFNNGMVKYKKDKDGYATSMVGLGFICVIICFSIIFLFHDIFEKYTDLNNKLLILMGINIFFNFIIGIWIVRNRYDNKYRILTILSVLFVIVEPILAIILIQSNQSHKVLLRVFSLAFTSMVFGTISFMLLFKKSKKIVNTKYWKYALILDLPLIPHYLSMVVLNSSDKIMIGNIVGESQVAFYSISYNVAVIMRIVLTSLNGTFLPWVYKKMDKKEYKDIKKNSSIIVLIIAVISTIPMFFAREAVLILGGQEYIEASAILPILSSSVFIMFFYSLFIMIELYFEKSRYVAIGSTCAALINVVLNYIFISIYGYQAAAYTTLASYSLLAAFHYVMYRKTLKEKNVKDEIFNIKIMTLTALGLLTFSLIISKLHNNMMVRYSLLCIMLFACLINKNKIIKIIKKTLIHKEKK